MASAQARRTSSAGTQSAQTSASSGTEQWSNLEAQMASRQWLKLGSTGPGVSELQTMLGQPATGTFDEATHEAVVAFQGRYKLGADGVVGPSTFRTLKGVATAGQANAVLFEHETAGASATTARQDRLTSGGVGASEKMAESDETRVMKHASVFLQVGAELDLPPALLMAIASRETRGGGQLKADGYSMWDAQGFGLMQVDKNSHTPRGGATSYEHVKQAAGILKDMLRMIEDKFPDWTASQQLQGAVAAYNKGASRVRSLSNIDNITTGGDYSSDVWARARFYATQLGEKLETPQS
jgi:hypothetical protein